MQYKGYIYCIRNKINNKKYIGQTSQKIGYKKRWNEHKNDLINNKHHSKNLQEDFNKQGVEVFEFTILEEYTFSDRELLKNALIDREKYYIKLFNTENDKRGYNNPIAKDTKRILCIETNQIFYGSKDVINRMFNGKGNSSTIRDHLRGRTKSAFKYHFKYIEE